jgi:hypothetical protein
MPWTLLNSTDHLFVPSEGSLHTVYRYSTVVNAQLLCHSSVACCVRAGTWQAAVAYMLLDNTLASMRRWSIPADARYEAV